MRWGFNSFFAPVGSHNYSIVHWEPLIGVHSDTEQPGIGLQESNVILHAKYRHCIDL